MSTPVKLTPTNIITGFLGVGKTTAILQLLKSKPSGERWAVLVNEFGEVGIDGALLGGATGNSAGVFIKEVPGGCMCCAAGLPMQVALNVLLKQARPDRLLIEPTGLGHPKEVLQVLSAEHYQAVLDIQNTITLVDARKITQARYTEHPIFMQQLEVADVIVANKVDQYAADELTQLRHFIDQQGWQDKPLQSVSMGQLSPDDLNGKAGHMQSAQAPSARLQSIDLSAMAEQDFPDCGYISYARKQEGLETKGWRFQSDMVFNQQALYQLIATTPMQRIKGVFITDRGIRGYNMSDDALSEIPLAEATESRIEIIAIAGQGCEAFEATLLKLAVRST